MASRSGPCPLRAPRRRDDSRGAHRERRTAWGKLTYGGAATLWRINVGWTRRQNPNQLGFVLDTERGYWARNEQALEDPTDPTRPSQQRVIPYVEDRRNTLLLEPSRPLDTAVTASLAAALKNAIQVVYDLEDAELAVEPLPSKDFRRQLLFYEAAEGGAWRPPPARNRPRGPPPSRPRSARALPFRPGHGEDRHRAPRAGLRPPATTCLLLRTSPTTAFSTATSFETCSSSRRIDDRGRTGSAPSPCPLEQLRASCDSELERRFLDFLEEHDLELPTHAQLRVERLRVKPDFTYAGHYMVVFVDGPPTTGPTSRNATARRRHARGRRLHGGALPSTRWEPIIRRYPSAFGQLKSVAR